MPVRLNVVVPAAGRSRRMGTAKLLIPWEGCSVIEHLLRAVRAHWAVDRVAVVCRADDEELQHTVRSVPGVDVVVPNTEPADMRSSVTTATNELATAYSTGWILIPADHPIVESDVLERMVLAWLRHPEKIAVPIHGGRRGHPTIFPATFPADLKRIPADKGINWLVREATPDGMQEVECPEASVLFDLDTPEDLARLKQMRPPDSGSESGGLI